MYLGAKVWPGLEYYPVWLRCSGRAAHDSARMRTQFLPGRLIELIEELLGFVEIGFAVAQDFGRCSFERLLAGNTLKPALARELFVV